MSTIESTQIKNQVNKSITKTNTKQKNNNDKNESRNQKYQEIISLNPTQFDLNMKEIADYLIDLEYNINPKHNNVDPCITLRNINFIISCYIWYYIRDDENWEFIQSLTDKEEEEALQCLITCHHEYKSTHFIQQQPGFYNTMQRIPKSLYIGSTIGIVSTVGAISLCIGGTIKLLNANIENGVKIYQERNQCDTKETLYKLPSIPLGICASIIIGGVVGATTLIAIPCVTLGSAGLYLVNGTDLTDIQTWQYIGKAKFNIDLNVDDNDNEDDVVVV